MMSVEISKDKDVKGLREKFIGKSARPGVELSVFYWRGVDIEDEKMGAFMEVDFDTEIV